MGLPWTYRLFIEVLLDAGRDLSVISHFVIRSFFVLKSITNSMSLCSTNDKLRRDSVQSVVKVLHGC